MPEREVNLTNDSWEDDIYVLKDYILRNLKQITPSAITLMLES